MVFPYVYLYLAASLPFRVSVMFICTRIQIRLYAAWMRAAGNSLTARSLDPLIVCLRFG